MTEQRDLRDEWPSEMRRPEPEPPHAYNRACRNTQHPGCTCMHPIDGRWCGRSRNDPIHDARPRPDPEPPEPMQVVDMLEAVQRPQVARLQAEVVRLTEAHARLRADLAAATVRAHGLEAAYRGLREIIGVVIAGLEHTTVADLGEVRHAIVTLTDACDLTATPSMLAEFDRWRALRGEPGEGE